MSSKKKAATKSQTKSAKAKAPASKKAGSNKATPKKARASKTAAKPVAAKKPAKAMSPAAPSTTKPAGSGLPPPRPLMPVRPPPVATRPAAKTKPLTEKDLAMFKDMLLKLRDRVIDEIAFLSRDNLNRSQRDASGDLSSYSLHMADQGTDNFDREFAANLLSSEQDVLYEIDEALRRIEAGTYGICEATGQPIEYERLKVLPFARYCVAAQAELEKGKPRFRPFRRTSIQTIESQS